MNTARSTAAKLIRAISHAPMPGGKRVVRAYFAAQEIQAKLHKPGTRGHKFWEEVVDILGRVHFRGPK